MLVEDVCIVVIEAGRQITPPAPPQLVTVANPIAVTTDVNYPGTGNAPAGKSIGFTTDPTDPENRINGSNDKAIMSSVGQVPHGRTGAGGAARAIAAELALAGTASTTIVNRTASRGQELVDLLRDKLGTSSKLTTWEGDYQVPAAADVLINATGFFRDPDTWRYLEREVLPAILERKGPGQPIRVWSAGCSSGQEAYTLAMLLCEALGLLEDPETSIDALGLYLWSEFDPHRAIPGGQALAALSRTDPRARRILEEYGAIFVADKKVEPPPVCIFTNEADVTRWQEQAGFESEFMSFDHVELQPAALKQLLKAREEAQKEGLDITPRDGAEAARRNYEDSVRLWNSRVEPALEYWLSQGRLTVEQVERMKNLPLSQQVAEVLELLGC